MPNIKTILNIDIVDTHNTKTLGIADASFYSITQSINNPTFEIYSPGFNKVTLTAIPSSINVFNSNNLNITCAETECGLVQLPDGIWTIRYSIAPNQDNYIEKSFMKTDVINCMYDNVFLKLDLDDSCDVCKDKDEDLEKLMRIRKYIIGSIAAGNTCDFTLANKLYTKAYSLIKKLDYNCDCLY